MATLHPFRALRPKPADAARIAAVPYDVVSTDEARALADGNPLSFLRVSRAGARAARRHRSVRGRRLPARGGQFRGAARQRRWCSRTSRASTSIGCGWAATTQTGSRRLLFARRVRPRRHQEARADAARQGGRPHAPHARARRADRSGVSHLPRRRTTSIASPPRVTATARRSSISRRRTACTTRSGGSAARIATRSSPRSRRIPALYIADGHHRAASAARAHEMRDAVPATSLGDGAERRRCWRSRFRTTRCRSCPTTGR